MNKELLEIDTILKEILPEDKQNIIFKSTIL